MIVQKGSINTTALLVPGLYVQIVPPRVSLLNGVPTNILGHVGSASWGPVNSPTPFSNMADYADIFGPIVARKYDMGTAVAAAVLQGANNHIGVRVTDGTDTKAQVTIDGEDDAIGVTFKAKYTGTVGNLLAVSLSAGSKKDTTKLTVTMPGRVPEVFDNIAGADAALWANIVDAVTLGQNGLRGPSLLITAEAGVSVQSPTLPVSSTLVGGTDGAGVDATDLIGTDVAPRSGMYALRNTKCSIAELVDMDDSTHYTDQVSFGLAEGIYMVATGPVSQYANIPNAVTAKNTAGIDSYAMKLLLGDWVYFNDTVNGVTRLISPQGFVAGRLANLSPEQSSLNKQIYGIVATESSKAGKIYSDAELGQLAAAGIDVVTNPCPGGNYFGCRIGHNTSSDPTINGDNYTRMTNYIAATLDAGMGKFIGRLQTKSERLEAKAAIENYLANMEQQEMIGDVNGGPGFQVVLDASNNPASRVALGYQQCDVQVKYLSIVEKFIINVEGGTSVQITKAS